MPALLEGHRLAVRFGGVAALKGVDLAVDAGEVLSVIGPNGAGKTTLFRMITGEEKPDSGTFRVGETVDLKLTDTVTTDAGVAALTYVPA